MSRNDRGKYFAIGLIAGMTLAILILLLSVPEFRNPASYQERYQSSRQDQNFDNGDLVSSYITPFVSSEDTLAQWVMAIFTILMAVTAALGAWWVRGTLQETKNAVVAANEAVMVTREIGQTQTRAYLSVTVKPVPALSGADYSTPQIFNIETTNKGQSPAIGVSVVAGAGWQPHELPVPCPDMMSVSEHSDSNTFPVGVGETTVTSLGEGLSLCDIYVDSPQRSTMLPYVFGLVFYKDVFGRRYKLRFAFKVEVVVETDRTPATGDTVNMTIHLQGANAHNEEVSFD